ncbi:hypothetical protein PS723_06323 [Pseudomonas fluorescens]|uniref:Uncharacterized protein n=1 Tax=Pseudomonas fluorescens TaxID=294 RepID=A0A5E7FXW4_PSEFL|nr:hypothetical protein PS723_06323 [Pseudomonas fluorescens]
MGNEIVAGLKTSLGADPVREVDQKIAPMAPTSLDGRCAA